MCLNFARHLFSRLHRFLFTVWVFYLFLNEPFNAKGSDYNHLFTPNKWYLLFHKSCSIFLFYPAHFASWLWAVSLVGMYMCQRMFTPWKQSVYTMATTLSKYNFVECTHENLNWPWYEARLSDENKNKRLPWGSCTQCVCMCDQSLCHSAKLNRGNYCCPNTNQLDTARPYNLFAVTEIRCCIKFQYISILRFVEKCWWNL